MNLNDYFEQLQGIDPQQPGRWPRWIQIGAAILLGVLLIGGSAYFMIMPDYDDLQQRQSKEQDLRKQFEEKQRKVSALDAYKTQLDQMQHDFGDMLRQLPNKTEVANLLNDISQARIAAGLEEELFQPQSEVQRDFYAELPNHITVTGTYAQMGDFVSAVAALPRIVTIDQIELRPSGDPAKNQLRMTAVAKTYRYLDDSEQSAHRPAPQRGH